MDINKILKADYLDILFEGRNKSYGGYELRRKYPVRMRNAGIIGLSVLAVILAGPVIADALKDKTVKKTPPPVMKEIVMAEPPPIDENKPPPPPAPSEPPPPAKPTVKFTPPVIKKDEEVKEDEKPADKDDLKDKVAGTETRDGDLNGSDIPSETPGTGSGPVEAPPPPKEEIFQYVDQMPEPSVDIGDFLRKNLQYPQMARDANVQGKVTLKFVVDEEGRVSNITVVKGIGSGCDEEAKRVVASMPPWKPGKQNGKPVKVYYNLPIRFQLQ